MALSGYNYAWRVTLLQKLYFQMFTIFFLSGTKRCLSGRWLPVHLVSQGRSHLVKFHSAALMLPEVGDQGHPVATAGTKESYFHHLDTWTGREDRIPGLCSYVSLFSPCCPHAGCTASLCCPLAHTASLRTRFSPRAQAGEQLSLRRAFVM